MVRIESPLSFAIDHSLNRGKHMQWEYKTIKLATTGWVGGKLDEVKFNTMLNELGRDRWELVSAFDTNQSHGASRDVVAIFKRPVEK